MRNNHYKLIEQEECYSHELPIFVNVCRIPKTDKPTDDGLRGPSETERGERGICSGGVCDWRAGDAMFVT